MTKCKCPFCGRLFAQKACRPLIPRHTTKRFDTHTLGMRRGQCPGTGQHPRNAETDNRPLWKDDIIPPTYQPDYKRPGETDAKTQNPDL